MTMDVEKAAALLWASRLAEANTLELRFCLLLDVLTDQGGYGAWTALESRTGILAARWRKAYTHQQRPTPDMIEAACALAPQHALWLVAGGLATLEIKQTVPALVKKGRGP